MVKLVVLVPPLVLLLSRLLNCHVALTSNSPEVLPQLYRTPIARVLSANCSTCLWYPRLVVTVAVVVAVVVLRKCPLALHCPSNRGKSAVCSHCPSRLFHALPKALLGTFDPLALVHPQLLTLTADPRLTTVVEAPPTVTTQAACVVRMRLSGVVVVMVAVSRSPLKVTPVGGVPLHVAQVVVL